jgi:hypothetical protein
MIQRGTVHVSTLVQRVYYTVNMFSHSRPPVENILEKLTTVVIRQDDAINNFSVTLASKQLVVVYVK